MKLSMLSLLSFMGFGAVQAVERLSLGAENLDQFSGCVGEGPISSRPL